MSSQDRQLYVQSLVGEERAKDSKGGRGKPYGAPASEYVSRIDEAYARGDRRAVHEIFAELEPSR